MDLRAFGWDSEFAVALAALGNPLLVPGRVIAEHKGWFTVMTSIGEVAARPAGRLRGGGVKPAVGDWVALRSWTGPGAATIQAVLPRRSRFARRAAGERFAEQVVAANVDTLLVVMGLDGDFNLRRLERYLALAEAGGAGPVIILTKADLCDDVDARVAEAAALAPRVPIVVTSVPQGRGLSDLRALSAPGRTVALVGSSGTGKSTLVNWLLGADVQTTRPVREDDRGRHTTSRRELFRLPDGALIIDTPGMRELQLLDVPEAVNAAFGDIAALAAHCRFRDCAHREEPDCAVNAAVAAGELDPARLASWRKLIDETAAARGRGPAPRRPPAKGP